MSTFNEEHIKRYIQFTNDYVSKHASLLEYAIANPVKKAKSYEKGTPEHLVITQFYDEFYEDFINLDGLRFDLKGHYDKYDGRLFKEVIEDDALYHDTKENIIKQYSYYLKIHLIKAYNNKDKNNDDYVISFMTDHLERIIEDKQCDYCDSSISSYLDYELNKIVLYPHLKECPRVKNGEFNEVTINLKAPSKKLVFLNNPSDFISIDRPDQYTVGIGSVLGRMKESEAYAEQNVGYFSITNSACNIFKGEHEIIIAPFNDESEEYENLTKTHEYIGNIDTDLWWYTVLDYDLFIDLCKKTKTDIDDIEHVVVDIPQTHCSITHNLNINDHMDSDIIYSKITL